MRINSELAKVSLGVHLGDAELEVIISTWAWVRSVSGRMDIRVSGHEMSPSEIVL